MESKGKLTSNDLNEMLITQIFIVIFHLLIYSIVVYMIFNIQFNILGILFALTIFPIIIYIDILILKQRKIIKEVLKNRKIEENEAEILRNKNKLVVFSNILFCLLILAVILSLHFIMSILPRMYVYKDLKFTKFILTLSSCMFIALFL